MWDDGLSLPTNRQKKAPSESFRGSAMQLMYAVMIFAITGYSIMLILTYNVLNTAKFNVIVKLS